MKFRRQSGVLLHPTSLPGPYGIGEIGSQAIAFADTLKEMGQRVWQVLPLGPTCYGDSPYQSQSTFAGNQLLVSFEQLVEDGLLSEERLASCAQFYEGEVDYNRVIAPRMKILIEVCDTFDQRCHKAMREAYEAFLEQNNSDWLDDYALFVALKRVFQDKPWTVWDKPLADREPGALREVRRRYATKIRKVKIMQFLFYYQWHRILDHCRSLGIRLFGDIPIFVAHDSADVWVHRDLFNLDDEGNPTAIAGVPPDYFSETGQRWGNPLYRWDVMQQTGFEWWKKRLHHVFEMVDIVRIDHFRGFESYWEIPAREPTAIHGRWVPGPGNRFFDEMLGEFGELPIVAEDLGIITPEVEALRDRYEFPGMRVLQFAFGNDPLSAGYRPENYIENCVCYIGTHDNDTTVGWFQSVSGEGSTRTNEEIEQERRTILEYLDSDGTEIHWDLIRLALNSKANTVIFSLQDVLGLDSSARLNTPGRQTGNWSWRFTGDQLTEEIKQRLYSLTETSDRI